MRKDWIEVDLGSVLIQSKEKYQPKVEEDHFYIGLEHIEKNLGILTDSVRNEKIITLKNQFRKGQILYGKLRPYLNKVYLAKESGVCSTDILVFQPTEVVLPRFAHLFMLSRKFVNEMSENTSGVNLPRVSTSYINSYSFPLPPLPEQRAIVARIEELFSELDHAISNLNSAQAKLEIYRQAVLKKAFEGHSDWTTIELGKIAKIKGGKRLPNGHTYSENTTENPYLRVVDFGNQSIIRNNLKYIDYNTYSLISRYTISSNDVYISIAGTIGRVGMVPEKLSGSNLTENAAKITEISGVENRFLVWFLSSKHAQDQIREKTIATTQPKLALYRIEKIEIKFPIEIVVQKKIVLEIESKLSVTDKLADTVQTNLLKSESLRQSILKKAFEGKLLTEAEIEACKKEADWEPAERLLERTKNEKNKTKKS